MLDNPLNRGTLILNGEMLESIELVEVPDNFEYPGPVAEPQNS